MVVIVFGLPGSGKTYFATALAKSLGYEHFNTDGVRKVQAANPEYSYEKRMEIYDLLLKTIKSNSQVVIDGTFYKKEIRQKFIEKAKEVQEVLLFIEIKASDNVIKERVNRKRTDSDADYSVYQSLKKEFDALIEEHLILYSDQMEVGEMVSQAIQYLQLSS